MIATCLNSVYRKPQTSRMKNFEIKFSLKFLAIILFFSCGKAKKTYNPGQVNYTSEHFYMTARSKCKTFQINNFLLLFLVRNKHFLQHHTVKL